MAAPRKEIFHLGFRFNPSPQEAVTYYLPRLIAGAPLHEAVRPAIHHADVYACEPGALARRFRPLPKTGDRFFFTTCKLQPHKAGKASKGAVRVAGPGSWSSQHTTVILDGAGAKVGEIKKLRYKKGDVFSDWLMEEYSCCLKEAVVGDTQRVLCKVYVSPRAAPDSEARQESAAVFVQPAPEEPIIAQAAPKRPAPPPVAESPPHPKRTRCAVVVPTPPTVQPGCTTSHAPPRPCVPHRGTAPSSTPSVTRPPASALPPAPVQTRPVVQPGRTMAYAQPRPRAPPHQLAPLRTPSAVRACSMPQQAPARQLPLQPPSVQTPLALMARAPCSPMAARDPFCMESPAAAQDEDDDLVKFLEDTLPTDEAEVDDELVKFLEDTLPTDEAEEETAANSAGSTTAEADGGTKQHACTSQDLLHVDDEVRNERDPFAAAIAREAVFMRAQIRSS